MWQAVGSLAVESPKTLCEFVDATNKAGKVRSNLDERVRALSSIPYSVPAGVSKPVTLVGGCRQCTTVVGPITAYSNVDA